MNTLTFHNKQLNIINQNNQIWLTSSDIAKALGYASTKSITTIFNRNNDEFSLGMSQVINLMTNGVFNTSRQKSVRIFSLRGAHLIAMFSRTPIAKDFRRWVLDILDKEVGNTVTTPVNPLIEIVKVNKAGLECLIHHASIAREILESNKIYEVLDSLGNNTVSKAYHHLNHGLMGAACLNVGIKCYKIKNLNS